MNNPLDPSLRELNDCGCCAGTTAETPATIDNRPGLDAIAFRAGTYPQFKATLLTSLSASEHSALKNLRTRDEDDFTVALLDGWATVGDILTFYSERIANESYLRTATERCSVLELARAIGYELKPGVAASAYLAFTVEEAPGAPGYANIPRGLKVQSVPGPDEKPQVYETTEAILARKEWNELKPVHTHLPAPYWGQRTLRLLGTSTNLKPGDALLIVGDQRKRWRGCENWDFRRVTKVETMVLADPPYTLVTLDRGLGAVNPHREPATENAKVYVLRLRANLFGYNAPDWRTLPRDMRLRFRGTEDVNGNLIPPKWPGFTIAEISDKLKVGGDTYGLWAEYFFDSDFQNSSEVELLKTPSSDSFSWDPTNMRSVSGSKGFSLRLTGYVKPDLDGSCTFHIEAGGPAGSVRLWIDEALVIDGWDTTGLNQVGGKEGKSSAMRLEAHRKYALRLEFTAASLGTKINPLYLKLCSTRSNPKQTVAEDVKLSFYPPDITRIHLDASYPKVLPEGWLVLETPYYTELYGVTSVAEDAKADFTLTAKTTRVGVEGENLRDRFNDKVRETAVFAQSEELERAPEPVLDAVAGDAIPLENLIPELPVPRTVLVRGAAARVRVMRKGASLELTRDSGTTLPLTDGQSLILLKQPVPVPTETVTFRWELQAEDGESGWVNATLDELCYDSAPDGAEMLFETVVVRSAKITDDGHTQLTLAKPFAHAYDPSTVSIFANVAYATHGETVNNEILGSGDTGKSHQRFTLRQKPVTYTPSSAPSGGDTTLEIRVNEVKWQEVDNLYGRGPGARVYVTRLADDGTVTVLFGDGRNGARLPTGIENVRAVYRKGIGLEGHVNAGQLSLLMTRPLGVKSVTNPEPGEGAQDPQRLADARRNAPQTVLTLNRIVSLQDYEDYARNFSGIAKAHGVWTWCRHTRGVFLTVAGIDGVEVADTTLENLMASLQLHGNSLVPVQVKSYDPTVQFRIKGGTVYVAADRTPEKVGATVKDAIEARFSFEARDFGQGVALSEIIAAMQGVPGVVAIGITELIKVPNATSQSHLLERSKKSSGSFIPAPGGKATREFRIPLIRPGDFISKAASLTVLPTGLDRYLSAAKPIDGVAAAVAQPAELLTLNLTCLNDLEVLSG